jgi:hypothetical protein
MRFLVLVFVAVLGTAMFLLSCPAEARPDPVPDAAAACEPAPVQPGTDAEEAAYALREAESPEAGEFAGGHGGFVFVVVLAAAVVLLVLLLQKEGKV